MDSITGDLIDSFSLRGVGITAAFVRDLAIKDGIAVLNGFVGDEPELVVAFDVSSRTLLPVEFTKAISTDSIEGFALGSDDRLFFLYADPPRIEVLLNWNLLTTWRLEKTGRPPVSFPAGIELDSRGNIYFIDGLLRILVFEP